MATVTKTVGSNSRDYASFLLAEADVDNDTPFDAGDDIVFEVYNDSVFDEENIVCNGGGTLGINSVRFTAPSSERHDGTAGSGVRIVPSGTDGRIFDVNAASSNVQWIFEDLELSGDSASSHNGDVVNISGSDSENHIIRRCIIHGHTSSSAALRGIKTTTNVDVLIYNNVIYDLSVTGTVNGDVIGIDSYNDRVANNTLYNLSNTSTNGGADTMGIKDSTSGTPYVWNNIALDCTADTGDGECFTLAFDNDSERDYNYASDATADGPNSQNTQTASATFVSIVAGSEDLHIVSSSNAYRTGADLTAEGNGCNVDIDGVTRDTGSATWDIGADQLLGNATAVNFTSEDTAISGFSSESMAQ